MINWIINQIINMRSFCKLIEDVLFLIKIISAISLFLVSFLLCKISDFNQLKSCDWDNRYLLTTGCTGMSSNIGLMFFNSSEQVSLRLPNVYWVIITAIYFVNNFYFLKIINAIFSSLYNAVKFFGYCKNNVQTTFFK